eukprot:359883-Chlamydomonas_euryale.AAC.4
MACLPGDDRMQCACPVQPEFAATTDEQVRAHVERQILQIADGKADKASLVSHTLNQFRQKFLFFVMKISRMDALFEASFSPLASSGGTQRSNVSCQLLQHCFWLHGKHLPARPSEWLHAVRSVADSGWLW